MNRDTGHDESIIANNVLIWGGGDIEIYQQSISQFCEYEVTYQNRKSCTIQHRWREKNFIPCTKKITIGIVFNIKYAP